MGSGSASLTAVTVTDTEPVGSDSVSTPVALFHEWDAPVTVTASGKLYPLSAVAVKVAVSPSVIVDAPTTVHPVAATDMLYTVGSGGGSAAFLSSAPSAYHV